MNEKIMVADDSIFARNILIDILQNNGYKNIIEASDGLDTLEKYESNKPNVLLLDLIMDKMDGLEVLEKVMLIDKNAKVIVVSAVGQNNIIKKARAVGAKDFIIKPIDEDRLIDALKKVME